MTARGVLIGALFVAASVSVGCSSTGSGGPTTTTRPSTDVRSGRPSPGCSGRPGRGPGAVPAERTIDVEGRKRRYLLATPRPSSRPAPMVVLLHGFDGDAAGFAALTRMPTKGTAAGLVVVVPDAGAPSWALGESPDDAFVAAAIAQVEAEQCIAMDRIGVAGFSLGAAFAISYACTHPRQIAALATVAVDFQLGCRRPVPYLAFHGDADPLVRYQDGAEGASLPGISVRGTLNNLADWSKLDRCAPAPRTRRIAAHVVRRTWVRCAPGTDVSLFTIEGGSHAWPGGDPSRPTAPMTQEVDATAQILCFFTDHPLVGAR